MTIRIQNNLFGAKMLPTTQEDNFGGVMNKYSLIREDKEVGILFEYFSNKFAIIHEPFIRYEFENYDVNINK